MALLTLGGVDFLDFEIPGKVSFGGSQQLAVHKLIGGTRVIDVMGRDDAAIRWRGVFSGLDAGDRARMVDAMRVAGLPLSLSWDEFCYNVLIDTLHMEFCSPWWIPYEISCSVIADLAQTIVAYSPDLADAILSDLTSASSYYDVSAAIGATSLPDALTQGNTDYSSASLALTGAAQSIDGAIQSSQTAIGSVSQADLDPSDLTTLVRASGTLAQLCVARGYVERSINNLDGAGT